MKTVLDKRLVVALLVLCAITLSQLSVRSIDEPGSLGPNAVVTAGAIIAALVKVRIIIREFMEVRHAPALLGRLTDLWVVVTGVSLLGSYFVGMALSNG